MAKKKVTKKAKKATKKTAKVTKKKASKNGVKNAAKKTGKKTTTHAKTKKVIKATAKKATPKTTKTVAPKKQVKKIKNSAATTTGDNRLSMTLVGTEVPAIEVPATGGKVINLKNHEGKKVVLFFYPKDMTPGCTIEGREFSQLKTSFEEKNTVVYGVSRDTVTLHEKFKEQESYTIDLLADTDEKICRVFDVLKDKNMYGKMVRGIERSTFVISEDGKIEKEWRKVKPEGHAGEVLAYLTQPQTDKK